MGTLPEVKEANKFYVPYFYYRQERSVFHNPPLNSHINEHWNSRCRATSWYIRHLIEYTFDICDARGNYGDLLQLPTDVTISKETRASFSAPAFGLIFGCTAIGSPTFWHWISVTVAVLPSAVDSENVTPRRAARVAACARAQASRGASARGRSRSRP